MSDEQEILDKLKDWWSENGRWVIAGLVLGIAGIIGWQQWNAHKARVIDRASDMYLQFDRALGASQFGDAVAAAERLIVDHPRTVYADNAMLRLADYYVEYNQVDGAVLALRRVVDNSSDRELRSLAALRLARVLLYEKADYNAALAALTGVDDVAFGARAAEIRGDIYGAMGNTAGAVEAYQQALAHPDRDMIDANFVNLKLRNLTTSAAPPQGVGL